MIRFNFGIVNWRQACEFRNLYSRGWSVSQNRTLEVQFYRYNHELLGLTFDLQWRGCDHAGPEFEINVLGWNFRITLPDRRHWDYDIYDWEQLN
jgi:hypothetical protein